MTRATLAPVFTLAIAFAATALVGCGATKGLDVQQAETNPVRGVKEGPGLFSGKSGNLLDAFKKDNGGLLGGLGGNGPSLNVNPYLWRAALDSVSFMPLLQADSNGGVIVTDWYTSPANPSERVKLTLIITGQEIAIDSLKINMFKQVKSGSEWKNSPVSVDTTRALEDALLTKARALRVSELNKK